MGEHRRTHEDIQCDDIKIMKEWKKEHSDEHRVIWERLQKMDDEQRSVRDIVIELKTKMMVLTATASLIGGVIGQVVARLFTK